MQGSPFITVKCKNHVEKMNELFFANGFNWLPLTEGMDHLDARTRDYLNLCNIPKHPELVKVAKQVFKDKDGIVYVFQIDDKRVRYLIHAPDMEAHMWGDKDFENLPHTSYEYIMGLFGTL